MPPVLMSIPGFEPRKGCRVCRINEPAPPGHSCRLKQKERKKCRSSMSLSSPNRCCSFGDIAACALITMLRTVPLRFLASSESKFFKTVQISRRTKARRRQGSEPAPRVKQRVKIKMSRSQSRIPQEMQAGRRGNPAKRKTARSCGVVLVVKMFAMRASQRCVHSSI